MLYVLFFFPFSSVTWFFTTIEELAEVALLERDCVDNFAGRACVDGLFVRIFFEGEAIESSLEVSNLRADFGLGDIFSELSVAFGVAAVATAAAAFADGRPTFGRCSFNGLTFFFGVAAAADDADDDDTLNSNSPLFALPSAFKPSANNLRHFS